MKEKTNALFISPLWQ